MELTRRLLTGMLAAVLAVAPALACCLQTGAAHAHAAGLAPAAHGASHAAPDASHCDETAALADRPASDRALGAGACPDCDDCASAPVKKDIATAKAPPGVDGPLSGTLAGEPVVFASTPAPARRGVLPPATAPPRPTPVSLKDVLRR
ncbi:MAG: hypothetical protein Kow00133_10050 [Amphiplicatus sp.]